MKDMCKALAEWTNARLLQGNSNLAPMFLSHKLTPIEAAVIAIRLYDMAHDYHRAIILRQLEKALREHFVLDTRGRVVLAFDSADMAAVRAAQLGKGYSVLAVASK